MAILGKFIHTPTERKRYTIDYSGWLTGTELVSSVVFASKPTIGSPAVVDTSTINSPASTVTIFISGGVDGIQYTIAVTMTSSLGQIKEDTILIQSRTPQGT